MTFTKDCELAGLSLVLQSSTAKIKSTPLSDWLSECEHSLAWVPLAKKQGVTKIFVASSPPELYPELMEVLWLKMSKDRTIEWLGNTYEVTGVEVDSAELHVLQIPIYATAILPLTLGRAIHALFFHWLELADSALAEKLHAQETLPISIVMVSGKSPRQMFLKIGIFQKKFLAPLLWGLSQDLGNEITLGGVTCSLGHCVEIVQSSRFELLCQVPSQKEVSLQFLSPTSFKQSQVIQPFPLPELVFGSLLRRWNAFAPVEFQFSPVEWRGMTSAFELKTQVLKMKAGAEIGATGWVRYEFPDSNQAQIAATLAHFASFAGVGRKTAMGMGHVRLRIS
jgi:CRISPR-associated endoribonuclease Cas6